MDGGTFPLQFPLGRVCRGRPCREARRLVFRAVGDIIWIGFSLYVAWIGLACIEEGLYYPEVSPTLGVVKAWVECIIPFSFVLVSWRIVEEYVVRWRNGTLGELVRYEEAA